MDNPVFKHQLEIMQAINDGKKIQIKAKNIPEPWREWPLDEIANGYVRLAFESFEFRIKPNPIEQDFWYKETPTNRLFLTICSPSFQESSYKQVGYRKIKMIEVLD